MTCKPKLTPNNFSIRDGFHIINRWIQYLKILKTLMEAINGVDCAVLLKERNLSSIFFLSEKIMTFSLLQISINILDFIKKKGEDIFHSKLLHCKRSATKEINLLKSFTVGGSHTHIWASFLAEEPFLQESKRKKEKKEERKWEMGFSE